jgi:hypothetical protein
MRKIELEGNEIADVCSALRIAILDEKKLLEQLIHSEEHTKKTQSRIDDYEKILKKLKS